MKEVGQLARQTAAHAGLDEAFQDRVEMAGLVHDIGLLGMPEGLLEKDERVMTAEEFEAYAQHPEIAALSLSSVEGLKEISVIVGAHHENLDGNGFPGRLQGESLPMGARILAVTADYGTILHLWPRGVKRMFAAARRYLDNEALSTLDIGDPQLALTGIAEKILIEGAGKRYDGAVVDHFLKAIGSDATNPAIHKLAYNLLKKGMVLKEDLRLKDGRLLLTRGTVLGDGALQSIQTIGSRDMIDGAISVMVNPPEPAEGETQP
jgi:hypothetical protein